MSQPPLTIGDVSAKLRNVSNVVEVCAKRMAETPLMQKPSWSSDERTALILSAKTLLNALYLFENYED